MASTVSSGLQKVTNTDGPATNNPKLADIAKDTYNTEDTNTRITTDFGRKVGDTDHWLSVSTEDRYGPALLEDTHGREKVWPHPKPLMLKAADKVPRFIDSTMSVFRNVLSMREELVLLAPSSYTKARKMSPTQAYSQIPPAQLPYLYGSLLSLEAEGVQILYVMYEASP